MKIYYSRMNQTPEATFISELAILTEAFGPADITFHGGGQYHEDKLLSAKIVVVTGSNGDLVGRGVFAEINNAIINKIPVYRFSKEYATIYNGTVLFYKIIDCDLYDVTDYYLRYGKCRYYQVGNIDVKITMDSLVSRFNDLQESDKKKPVKKSNHAPWASDHDEGEFEEEIEDYSLNSFRKDRPEAKKMPSDKKPNSSDFEEDTNMMY